MPSPRSRSLELDPATWRTDLLRIVLRGFACLGGLACVPSVFVALKSGLIGVALMDTVALGAVLGLAYFEGMKASMRAAGACAVMYLLGVGLMATIGSGGQAYLFGFSLMTTLLLAGRWGLATVALNTASMLFLGFVGLARSGLVMPARAVDFAGWSVITLNFALVNLAMVLAVGAVINALESALGRALVARAAQEHEQAKLVKVNESLAEEVRVRARTEASLRDNRALLRIAGRTARLGGWQVDVNRMEVVWSDEVCELHEVPVGTLPTVDEAIAFYPPEWRDTVRDSVSACAGHGAPFDLEAEIVTANGARLWVRSIGNALRNGEGAITHVHGSIQDITPRKLAKALNDKLEDQLRQAQKLETVGSLAAGVAHDFNNLLSVILSYSDLLASDLEPGSPMRADLDEIRGAGLRAADLTRQLLAFSRQQVLAPKVVDLNRIVVGMEKMLRRLIGADVELTATCASGLGNVLVDPGQMEQVIMNLAVNARDAMPRGGMLTIETAEVVLDARYASEHVGVTPGRHVMLAVSDTGTGIDKATQARMFEPFFTTKEQGKGTGLGLATVFGIVQQSGGTLWVYSEPGEGTCFKIYFPLADPLSSTLSTASPLEVDVLQSETILLVEDEERVRFVTQRILRKQGYNVLCASSGSDALSVSEQHGATIHLLLTDVVMPRMSGRELAEELLPLRPDMKLLYMSGYTDDAVVRHGILDSSIAFLQKPLTAERLTRKIREVLDAPTRMLG